MKLNPYMIDGYTAAEVFRGLREIETSEVRWGNSAWRRESARRLPVWRESARRGGG